MDEIPALEIKIMLESKPPRRRRRGRRRTAAGAAYIISYDILQ